MRILCLDYGDKTVGVAVSDQLRVIAYGLETIFRHSADDLKNTDKRLLELVREYDIGEVVVGLPKKLDNSCGLQCEKTFAFKDHLLELLPDLKITLWDERMSSVAASRNLYSANVNSFGQKKIIDKMAAVFVLQGYLDFLKFQEDNKMDFDNNDFNSEEENVVVMFDEDGNEQELYVLGDVDYEEKTYLVVSEDLESDSDEQEVVVLEKVESPEAGEDDYHIVEDDDVLNKVMELFEEKYQNEFEDEENDEQESEEE